MALFAIKVGTGDGAGQQIIEAATPGRAICALEELWAENSLTRPSCQMTVAPASAVNFAVGVIDEERALDSVREEVLAALRRLNPDAGDDGVDEFTDDELRAIVRAVMYATVHAL